MTTPDTGRSTYETILSRLPDNAALLGRYSAVGLLGAVVFYSILWTMVELLNVPILVATCIAFVLVTIENYLLHYRWTYVSTYSHTVTFPRFSFMTIVGFWINWGIMAGGLHYFSVNYLLVQAVAIVAVVTWNYILSSHWIFSKRMQKQNG